MDVSPSLFDVPPSSALLAGANWLNQLITGSIALSLGIIGIAGIGFLFMTGRLAIREGVRVVMGCFILFGAPIIARSLFVSTSSYVGQGRSEAPIVAKQPPPQPLPPANYDPYAGASLHTN